MRSNYAEKKGFENKKKAKRNKGNCQIKKTRGEDEEIKTQVIVANSSTSSFNR